MREIIMRRRYAPMFRKREPHVEKGRTWRHEIPPPPPPRRFDAEVRLDRAWRNLALTHASFRATEQTEYRELVDELRDIERLFFDHPELSPYYDECQQPPSTVAAARSAAPDPRVRHVVAIQAQFMEDVYFVLQLARFPNALDNRGWMNLFRAWGASETFNATFDRLRHTFTTEFVEFFDSYLCRFPGTIEQYPIPHPWDSSEVRADPRVAAGIAPRPGEDAGSLRGVFLDSGLQEAGRHGARRGSSMPSPGTGSRGVKDESGNVGSPVDQAQSTEGGQGSSKKMPPNA